MARVPREAPPPTSPGDGEAPRPRSGDRRGCGTAWPDCPIRTAPIDTGPRSHAREYLRFAATRPWATPRRGGRRPRPRRRRGDHRVEVDLDDRGVVRKQPADARDQRRERVEVDAGPRRGHRAGPAPRVVARGAATEAPARARGARPRRRAPRRGSRRGPRARPARTPRPGGRRRSAPRRGRPWAPRASLANGRRRQGAEAGRSRHGGGDRTDRRLVAEPERDAARLRLVGEARRVDLERHRAPAELAPRRHDPVRAAATATHRQSVTGRPAPASRSRLSRSESATSGPCPFAARASGSSVASEPQATCDDASSGHAARRGPPAIRAPRRSSQAAQPRDRGIASIAPGASASRPPRRASP